MGADEVEAAYWEVMIPWYSDIIGKIYDRMMGLSPDTDNSRHGYWNSIPKQFIVRSGMREGQTILDLGTGTGTLARLSKMEVGEKGRVIGVDLSRVGIEKAKKQTRHFEDMEIDFRVANAAGD